MISMAERELYIATLAETPRRIAACTQGLSDDLLARPPVPKAWSVQEILAHLRACADLWTFSIYAMLVADQPELADIHPRQWSKGLAKAEPGFQEAFQRFVLEREQLIRVLVGLAPEAWERSAQIGKRRHTVFSQVRRMALHEGEHCAQIEETLKPFR